MNNKTNIKKYVSMAVAMTMLAGSVGALTAFADSTNSNNKRGIPQSSEERGGGMMGRREGNGQMMKMGINSVFGTVSAISGTTLTVNGKQGFSTTTPNTTFTVNAANAKIMKDRKTGTIASIVVGDTVAISGTVTGSNVVATIIRDGALPPRGMDKPENFESLIQGNGQPIIGGTVSAVNGNSITLTNKSNITYTVDITNAKILGKNATSTKVVTGDAIIVQGSVNGTSIVASQIIDQVKPTTPTQTTNKPEKRGFFGGIGGFFSRFFGF